MKKKIGIIGFGNMGSAIAERIKSDYQLFVFDKEREKTRNVRNIEIVDSLADLIKKANVIILAVKPQDLTTVFNAILSDSGKNVIKNKLFISIAAGVDTKNIEASLGKVRIVRVMPNLPAKVGRGMICLCKGKHANKTNLDFVKQLFEKLGKTLIMEEKMIDKSTAISGSGPGYFYYNSEGKDINEIKSMAPGFVTSLTVTAEEIGFSLSIARILAETTVAGSIVYLEETKLSPKDAEIQVASRGGTTEAGLEVLHKGGSLTDAVKAALKRARELGKKIKFIRVG